MPSALKDTDRRENPGSCFLSNGFLRSREAPAFPPAPSETVFFANFAGFFAHFAVKCFYRKVRKRSAKDAKRNRPSPPRPGMPIGRGGRKLNFYYRCVELSYQLN